MQNIVNTILAFVFLAVLIGIIPYAIWVIYTAVKKRWKRLGFQIVIPIIAFLALSGLSYVASADSYERYLEGLYNAEVKLGKPIFEYDSERDFNGDGYSFAVYELPSSIRTRFGGVDDKLLSKFPERPDYRDNWKAEPWREAPFDKRFEKYLKFALSSYDADNKPEMNTHFAEIRAALTMEGTFYSFFYNVPSSSLGDVDFFVVDLIRGRLYLINHNT